MKADSVNKGKDLKYYSTDKMYQVKKKRKLNGKVMSYTLLLIGLLVGLISVYFLNKGLNLSKKPQQLIITKKEMLIIKFI